MSQKDLKESAECVTMHGFGRVSATKRKSFKFLWVFFILASTCVLGVQLDIILRKYFSHPSVINSNTVIQTKMKFPAITICGFRTEKFNLTNQSVLPKNQDMQRMFSNVTESCKFGPKSFCSYEKDFKETLTIDHGVCSTFNPNGTLRQLRAGPFHGLTMALFINTSNSNTLLTDNGEGLEVFSHDHDDFPFTGSHLVAPGTLARIEINKKEIKRLPYPYRSNCTIGKKIPLLYPGRYTIRNCQESCYAYEMAKNCVHGEDYRNYYLPKHLRKPAARTDSELQCFLDTYDRLDANGFKKCGCQLPCHETKFSSSVSYSKWPSTTNMPEFKQDIASAFGLNKSTITDDYVRQNFAKINIFYADMSYEEISEVESYTWEKLISDIGGQMGIWIGASVFSIIELIYLSLLFVSFFCRRKSNKSLDNSLPPA